MASLPGQIGWPFSGDKTIEFARNPIAFSQCYMMMYRSRIFQARALNKPHAFIASNEGVKQVLEDKNNAFSMGYKDFGYMYHLYGDMVIFNNDDEALRLRKILLLLLKPERMTKYFGDIDVICSRVMDGLEQRGPVVLYKLFKLLTTEICLLLFLGLDFETAGCNAKYIVDLTIAHWHGLISVPVSLNVYGVKSGYNKAMAAKKQLLDVIYKQMSATQNGFLGAMMEAGFDSPTETANHVLLFVSALVPKALSSLLTSFCLELAKPENHRTRKRRRIDPIGKMDAPSNGLLTLLTSEIRKKAAKDNNYLDNVLLEVKRLWPPFLGGRRVARQDTVIDGYKIPKHYIVAYLTREANMDPEVFQDGHRFIPERWDDGNKGDRDRVWTFGSGPRVCVGDHFIHRIIKLIAKYLLQYYDWSLVEGQDLTYKWLPVSRPRNDIQVLFRKLEPDISEK